jgi:glycine reductase
MRLELHKIRVSDVQWGDRTCVRDGTLYVNREEALDAVRVEERLKSFTLELVRPGDSVRIIPVKDVLEPRCKLDGGEGFFPGFLADVDTVGQGKTLALSGAAVVTCAPVVGFQEGFIDMRGPGAAYTPFSETQNVVLLAEPVEDLEKHQYEAALRMTGFRLSLYLAEKCRESVPDEVEVFELPALTDARDQGADLPGFVYIYMLQSQGLLHDTYVYGVDAKKILPTLIHPNEVMDGAILSGNCVSACDKNTTFHHLNNPVIQELYRRHGKDLRFLGVIITNENVILIDKKRSSNYTAKLAALVGADAAIVTEEGYGNPDTDLVMNCKKLEGQGIRTVLITDEAAGPDGASQGLADAVSEADAVVSAGNVNAIVEVPPMDCVLGWPEAIATLSGGFDGSLGEDGSIRAEIQAIIGSTNELGFSRIGSRWV